VLNENGIDEPIRKRFELDTRSVTFFRVVRCRSVSGTARVHVAAVATCRSHVTLLFRRVQKERVQQSRLDQLGDVASIHRHVVLAAVRGDLPQRGLTTDETNGHD